MSASGPPVPNPAIVLDLGVNGLGVVRSLGRRGVRVLGTAFIERGAALHSRYCEIVELPSADEGEFLSRLLALCRSLPAPPVLYATSDESLSLLSKHEDRLAETALFVLPARKTMLDILNKDTTWKLAVDCGMRIPATYVAASFEDLCKIAGGMPYPVLFKPMNHYSFYLPGHAKNLVFRDPGEMTAYFGERPDIASKGVFQEIIVGGDGNILVCAAYFDRESEPLAIYTGRKIRQLQPDFGVTCYGVSEHLPEIAERTVCCLQGIRYRGLVAVEFVRERSTGQIHFLEINGRSYYHNELFRACGVDLSWIAYLDAVRSPMLAKQVHPTQRYGIKWLDFARDARSFRQKHRAGQLGWSSWLWSLTKPRSFAVFAIDDLWPFCYGASKLAWRQVMKATRRGRACVGRGRGVSAKPD